ncbi:MAG: PqqD family protein [Myxococcales bacterium]
MEELLDKKPAPHPEAAIENVGGRIMAATPDDQLHYFVEDGTDEEPSEVGDRIVELSDGTRTVRQIAECLCEEFDVDLETALSDTAEFVRQLVDCKVLQLIGGGQPASNNLP